MRFRDHYLVEGCERGYYEGPIKEEGNTALPKSTPVAPPLVWLEKRGAFEGAETVLDYGAGNGRNSDYLRSQGFNVYSFDPFNGKDGADGYKEVTTVPPSGKFDVAFSCFVINVVKKSDQDKIVSDVSEFGKKSFHISRNKDVFDAAVKSLQNPKSYAYKFFMEEFATPEEKKMLGEGTLPKKVIENFCCFGYQSGVGKFQRIPDDEDMENLGYRLIRASSGFKIYNKE